jgi:hypothetical protein
VRARPDPDGHHDHGAQRGRQVERGRRGVGVETAHLVHRESLVLGLDGQVGHGLTGVVARPRLRAAVSVDGAGSDEQQRVGVAGPGAVAGRERGEQRVERGCAPAGDDEPPRLAVAGRGRPARRLQEGGELSVADRPCRVERPGTPPPGEQLVHRNRGGGKLLGHRSSIVEHSSRRTLNAQLIIPTNQPATR